jgi:hypothetical protein
MCRILRMMYTTRNYWVSELYSSSGILNTRKHNVSETIYVSPVVGWETSVDGNRSSFQNVVFSSI